MKTLFITALCTVFLVTPIVLSAEETAPLGKGHFAVKLDYISFTDNFFDSETADQQGVYLGIEGYGRIFENLYLGGEIGAADSIRVFSSSVNFYPIELNLKYAIEPARNLVIDFGAGASYSYTELEIGNFFSLDETLDDWLLGGQAFGALTYKIKWLSIGVNAKYQITQDFQDGNTNLNSWRAGIQVGAVF